MQAGAAPLGEAVFKFQTVNPQKDAAASQQMLQKFVRWFGPERPMISLKPSDVETFGQLSGIDSLIRLAPVKAFLKYADDAGMTQKDREGKSLAGHLKVKRAPIRQRQGTRKAASPTARLSLEGHSKAVEDLGTLKAESLLIADDIKRAMADKDFRENAPLDAARDKQAHNASRIRDLEELLRSAEIISEDANGSHGDAGRCRIGSGVRILDLETKESIHYTLVDPKEVNVQAGKISVESPVGKALLNKRQGETVDVRSPSGSRQYKIEKVEGF